MAQQRAVPGIKKYTAPAGGWGALKATARAIREQMETGEAAVTLFRTISRTGSIAPDNLPGTGVIRMLDPGDTFTVKDLLTLMNVVSDNTARTFCTAWSAVPRWLTSGCQSWA